VPFFSFHTLNHLTAEMLVYSRRMQDTVRGLLWCDSTSQSVGKHFVNRDFNAAQNISRCFTSRVRPKELTRRKNSPPIRKVVGVRINV
jgi:hypothetical protein